MTGPVHPDWDRAGADWPNRKASHFAEVGRVRWHYQRMGAGPVLLLLHGTGASTHSWRDLIPRLVDDFDVIAPDLPGHAFTRIQSRQQCSLPAMAEAIGELCEHVNVRPHAIVGHSAGTAIALHTVLAKHLTASRIIGFNPALAPFRGLAGMIFPPLAKMLALNPVVPWMFTSLPGAHTQARRMIDKTGSQIDQRGLALYTRLFTRTDHVDGALAMMALWDLNPLLKKLDKITIPVSLFVGENDQMVPPNEAIALAEQHDQITTVKISRLGHLMHEEDPVRFTEIIKEGC